MSNNHGHERAAATRSSCQNFDVDEPHSSIHPPTRIRVHDARPRKHHPCDRTLMDRPSIARRPGRLHRSADPQRLGLIVR
jgi:hypothetical protein